jgi:Zn-dependent oligopeptidase
MVANLAKPTPEKPALMRHDDVVTFFHEMGHVFHGLLSKTEYSRFHGTRYAYRRTWGDLSFDSL